MRHRWPGWTCRNGAETLGLHPRAHSNKPFVSLPARRAPCITICIYTCLACASGLYGVAQVQRRPVAATMRPFCPRRSCRGPACSQSDPSVLSEDLRARPPALGHGAISRQMRGRTAAAGTPCCCHHCCPVLLRALGSVWPPLFLLPLLGLSREPACETPSGKSLAGRYGLANFKRAHGGRVPGRAGRLRNFRGGDVLATEFGDALCPLSLVSLDIRCSCLGTYIMEYAYSYV